MDDSGNVLAVDYDAECPAKCIVGGGEEVFRRRGGRRR